MDAELTHVLGPAVPDPCRDGLSTVTRGGVTRATGGTIFQVSLGQICAKTRALRNEGGETKAH